MPYANTKPTRWRTMAIICQAIDAGTELVEITRIATLAEQEARAIASVE